MTATPTPTEHAVRGTLLALLIVPVGIVVFVLISTVGFVASIVAFGVSFCAYWLYQRGAGGVITRTGAWIITGIVVGTILLSLYCTMLYNWASTGAAHYHLSTWNYFTSSLFWPEFNLNFSGVLSDNALFFVAAILFGALGSFRMLRRAFLLTSSTSRSAAAFSAPPPPPQPRTYLNDVDGAPTGSADDKTPPPTIGS